MILIFSSSATRIFEPIFSERKSDFTRILLSFNSLIISGKLEDKTTLYETSNNFIKYLEKKDYELDEKNKNAILTDIGIDKIEKLAIQKKILKKNNFYDPANIN